MCSNEGLLAADPLAGLAAVVDALAAQDVSGLPDCLAAGDVLRMRTLLERAEGEWLRRLGEVDARGAAGAELFPDPDPEGADEKKRRRAVVRRDVALCE